MGEETGKAGGAEVLIKDVLKFMLKAAIALRTKKTLFQVGEEQYYNHHLTVDSMIYVLTIFRFYYPSSPARL